MPVRNNLLVLMAKKNIRSYSELSRLSEVSYGAIRKFAIGQSQRFDADVMEKLCDVLECDLKELIYIEKKEVIS
ncbi:helix-turn-helix transcriptional regulator [Cytobacillus kochii]|uniref:helix-turn-helix domain-containing protein n=1 Tax=Cytobacillus kochii TaxID=859143 RepID=UPI001CD298E7|nr:helix-turn-helix transcriptional regulator [Cytobacillus kochii]MCA1029321.1 helix-turn-helix transcriptional regulator [Cytobacillus kochii]